MQPNQMAGEPAAKKGKAHTCARCDTPIKKGEEMALHSSVVCEDCYIDAVMSKMPKTYYEHDPSGFMRRLQESYSVHPQRYH